MGALVLMEGASWYFNSPLEDPNPTPPIRSETEEGTEGWRKRLLQGTCFFSLVNWLSIRRFLKQ